MAITWHLEGEGAPAKSSTSQWTPPYTSPAWTSQYTPSSTWTPSSSTYVYTPKYTPPTTSSKSVYTPPPATTPKTTYTAPSSQSSSPTSTVPSSTPSPSSQIGATPPVQVYRVGDLVKTVTIPAAVSGTTTLADGIIVEDKAITTTLANGQVVMTTTQLVWGLVSATGSDAAPSAASTSTSNSTIAAINESDVGSTLPGVAAGSNTGSNGTTTYQLGNLGRAAQIVIDMGRLVYEAANSN